MAAKRASKRRRTARKRVKAKRTRTKRRTKRKVKRKTVKKRSKKRKAKKKVVRRKKKKPKKTPTRGTRRQVFAGSRLKTKGGLKKNELVRNKAGRIVSAKASAAGKKRYRKNGLDKWIAAVQKVRKQMNLTV